MVRNPPGPAVLLAVVLLAGTGAATLAEANATGGSSLTGRITSETAKGGVANATIVAYHLSSGNVVRSQPTAANGRFEISGIERGYYDLAVEIGDQLWVVNQVVNVPLDGAAVANLDLVGALTSGTAPREFPGSDKTPTGIAQMGGGGMSKKKLGWAVGGGAGAAIVLGAAGGSSSGGGSASPAMPN